MKSIELTSRERNDRCSKCRYRRRITDSDGWAFLGCKYEPYHGKWVVEIEHCPLKKEGEEEHDRK